MKKLNKFFAVLVALAMMATLAVTMAFAEETTAVKTSAAPGKAVLTKDFDVPEGVSVPVSTFKFDFDVKDKPSSVTGTVEQQEIAFAAGLTGEQIKNLYLKDVFYYDATTLKIDTSKSALTQPGVYVYLVSENKGDSHYEAVEAPSKDNIDYDTTTKYTLRVYVEQKDDGLYIKTITVETGDTTATTTPSDPKNKVNPDEVVDNKGTDDTSDDVNKGSDFKFTNVYTKTVITDENDENGAFNIGKTVSKSGDKNAQFPFTVTINLDEKTTLTDNKLVGKVGDTAYPFNFSNGTATVENVLLKNGEKLKFTEFPAGATVTFEEKLAESSIQNKNLYTKATSGSALEAGQNFAVKVNASGTTKAIDAAAAVDVNNILDADDIEPEGVLINNLPYIALALVAVGGLVAYVVVRRKNEDNA